MGYTYMRNMAYIRARPDRNVAAQKINRKPANEHADVLQGWEVTENYDDEGGIEAWSCQRSLAESNGKNKDSRGKSPPVAWDAYIIHTGTKCSEIEDVDKFQKASLPERFQPKRLHLDLDFALNKGQIDNVNEHKQSNNSSGNCNGKEACPSPLTNPQNQVIKLKLSLSKGGVNGATNIYSQFTNSSNVNESNGESKPVQNSEFNGAISVDNIGNALIPPWNESIDGAGEPVSSNGGQYSGQRNNNVTSNHDIESSAYLTNGQRPVSSPPKQEHAESNSFKHVDKLRQTSPSQVTSRQIKMHYSHSQINVLGSNHISNSHFGVGDLRSSKLLRSKSEDNVLKDLSNNDKEDTRLLVTSERTKENGQANSKKDARSQYKNQIALVLNKVSFDSSSTLSISKTSKYVKSYARSSSARSKVSTVQLNLSDVCLKGSKHNHVLYDNGDQNSTSEDLSITNPEHQPSSSKRQDQLPVKIRQLTMRSEGHNGNGQVQIYDENVPLLSEDEKTMLKLSDTFQQFLGPSPFHPFQNKTLQQRAQDNATKKIYGLLQVNNSDGDSRHKRHRWPSASSKMYPRMRANAPSMVELKNSELKPKSEKTVTPRSNADANRVKSSKSRVSSSKYSVSSVYQSLPYKTSIENLHKLRRKGSEHDADLAELEKAREKLHTNVWMRSSTSQESSFIDRL